MKCKHEKQNNQPCQANAIKGSEFCYMHNPDVSQEEKRETQARGGKANKIMIKNTLPAIKVSKPDDVVGLLVETINQVRAGDMDIKVANCIGVLSGHLIKSLELAKYADKIETVERILFERRIAQ